ncbi:hypothetical protein D9M72_591100 [compost metagenome]
MLYPDAPVQQDAPAPSMVSDAMTYTQIDRAAPTSEGGEREQDVDATDEWRRLALQFDGHRMQALGHLKAMLVSSKRHAHAAALFLAAPPLSGEEVLAQRIAAIAKATEGLAP